MNLYKYLVLIVLFVLSFLSAKAQTYLADQGATLLRGNLYYSNTGVTTSSKQISIAANVSQFVIPKFFIGALLDFTNQSQGNVTNNLLGIGPQIGYVIGGEDNETHPFFVGGVTYEKLKSETSNNSGINLSGTDLFFGGGLIIPASDHLGFTIEVKYHLIDLQNPDGNQSRSGDSIDIGVGIAGLLY